MPVLISAAICTYNRSDLLAGALQSLCEQSLPPQDYEILVVDNASTDDTRAVVSRCKASYPVHEIRYLYETKQGLGYARNTAFQEARGAYVAYIDDDARASESWLKLALWTLAWAEGLICVGGPCRPFFTTDKPGWFRDEYEIRSKGEEMRFLEPGESFSGSNMIWDVDALRAVGGFAVNIGVSGETLSVGEETYPFRAIWKQCQDKIFLYNPDLIVYHWAPPHKMRVSYYLKRSFADGQAEFKLLSKDGLPWRALRVLRGLGYIVFHGIGALWSIPRYPFWQNWAVEEGHDIVSKLGLVCAALGIRINFKR